MSRTQFNKLGAWIKAQVKRRVLHMSRTQFNKLGAWIKAQVKRRVLHMSRTQFNKLGACEVRRLTQLSWTDFIWGG